MLRGRPASRRHAGWVGSEDLPAIRGSSGGPSLLDADEEELAVLDEPLHHVALLYTQGFREGAGDRDVVQAVGELLDADAVGHRTYKNR